MRVLLKPTDPRGPSFHRRGLANQPQIPARIESRSHLVVVELSRGIVLVGPDNQAFDQIPEVCKKVLRKEASVAGVVGDVLADGAVCALDLLLNGRH